MTYCYAINISQDGVIADTRLSRRTILIHCCTTVNKHMYLDMIKSFKHKGLQKYFTTGSTAGTNEKHASKLELRLQALHTATVIDDMDIPGWRLHALKGDRAGLWAVNVSGNWRVVFEFKDGHAYVIDYEDYH